MFFMIMLKFKKIQPILCYKNLSNIYPQEKQKLLVILLFNIYTEFLLKKPTLWRTIRYHFDISNNSNDCA